MRYLFTPKHVLGSDSFYVVADNFAQARNKAVERIKKEQWESGDGWDVFATICTINDKGDLIG